ncbi:hypothetical protein [Candidatus Villigracilis affinis]|uniref:hypothetical protein n=1 Tax=Candidatus Villigracilis affinis TaxID=3140682 RepID=UPI002A19CCE3|nr:hypothetical protein [Anaerolineales bacterium]
MGFKRIILIGVDLASPRSDANQAGSFRRAMTESFSPNYFAKGVQIWQLPEPRHLAVGYNFAREACRKVKAVSAGCDRRRQLDFQPSRQLRNSLVARDIYYSLLPTATTEQKELASSFARSVGQYEPPVIGSIVAVTFPNHWWKNFIAARIWEVSSGWRRVWRYLT